MTKRRLSVLVVAVIVVIGTFLYVNRAIALETLPDNRAVAGFKAPLSRTEVQSLAEEYNVVPIALYMANVGLTGTHRTYVKKDADAFFENAQAKTIESMEKGLKANLIRLERFVEQYSEEAVVRDERLQREARSLLRIRFQLEATLAATRGDAPFIYGAEFAGEEINLNDVRSDERIESFQAFNLLEARLAPHRLSTPVTAHRKDSELSDLQQMEPLEVYRHMKALVSQNQR